MEYVTLTLILFAGDAMLDGSQVYFNSHAECNARIESIKSDVAPEVKIYQDELGGWWFDSSSTNQSIYAICR